MRKTILFHPFWMMLVMTAFLSCSSDSDEREGERDVVPKVVVMYSLGGLGDGGYNDCILTGVQTFRKEHSAEAEVYQYSPQNMDEAERLFSDWLKLSDSDVPSLFVIASNDYETMMEKAMDGYVLADNRQMLLFESDNQQKLPVSHFRISMYGASFLAGVSAAHCDVEKALVMLAHPHDDNLQDAANGFRDGLVHVNPQGKIEMSYLSEDWSGFVADGLAYQKMYDWSSAYDFVFPLAGGSNKGVYRYTREYAYSPYTAGMDVEESGLSLFIVGSLVKRMDKLIVHYLEEWLKSGELPESAVYGLESGYVDWVIAPSYQAWLYQSVEDYRAVAVRKEEEYLHGK